MKKIIASIMLGIMVLSLVACGGNSTNTTSSESDTKKVEGNLLDPALYKSNKDKSEWVIAVVTKDNTASWFQRMEVGVKEFAEKTGIKVIQKGPANADAASQVEVIDDLINQGIDALCVIPIDPGAIEASLQNAMEKGIAVVTHEASNQKNTLFDIEAFTAEDFGKAIMDAVAKEMGEEGKYAMMVAYTTSTTHMEYANAQYKHQQEKYPKMELINGGEIPTAESEESIDTAYNRAREILQANPDLKGFTGVAATDTPGIAMAVEELGMDVGVVGVGTPNELSAFVKSGAVSTVKLWDPKMAGYAMCSLASKILSGEEIGEGSDLGVPGYEKVTLVEGINKCLVGTADITITKDNIDDYDF